LPLHRQQFASSVAKNKPLKTTFLARAHLEANAYILFVWAHILEVISMFEEDEEWEEVEEDEEDW
jgi:hypothetical protein